ncbi:sensor histidine kinase [Mobilicoccus caccae]|uniref:histidine kinase n=1 Tax=Mobilicoccus caccae TaxID=1859295 RepID=A0ABQ6IRP1_9MICO|nr:PAS domain-containing sensor histidine kinase [Mobilicoccus caccae]GMA40005.1 PAS domain-containing sensor histidine kinase [Mobilicoccus caccae]
MSRDDSLISGAGCDAEAVLSCLPDGVVVADEHGLVQLVNPRAAKLLGRRPEDVVGERVVEALPLLDAAGHSWWTCCDPWDGLATRTGHRERLLLLPGRGQVLVTMRYVRAEPLGPVVRVVVALRDTDARRRAETENAELISMVAHELRAPLASVKGFSSTLLKRWDRFTDTQKHLMIETIEADAERLARLIHELLDVSRLDTSRLRLDRRRVDLREVIVRCVERLVASGLDPSRFEIRIDDDPCRAGTDGTGPAGAGTAEVDTEVDAPTDPLPATDEVDRADVLVWADADRLDQIVTNLLENAVRHGAGTVHVSVSPQNPGTAEGSSPMWIVSVADEGEGIRPEQYALVFSKFWHGSRRGSTGLGLYLVRGLVEAHGGSISVDRAPEGGALFRFALPRASTAR